MSARKNFIKFVFIFLLLNNSNALAGKYCPKDLVPNFFGTYNNKKTYDCMCANGTRTNFNMQTAVTNTETTMGICSNINVYSLDINKFKDPAAIPVKLGPVLWLDAYQITASNFLNLDYVEFGSAYRKNVTRWVNKASSTGNADALPVANPPYLYNTDPSQRDPISGVYTFNALWGSQGTFRNLILFSSTSGMTALAGSFAPSITCNGNLTFFITAKFSPTNTGNVSSLFRLMNGASNVMHVYRDNQVNDYLKVQLGDATIANFDIGNKLTNVLPRTVSTAATDSLHLITVKIDNSSGTPKASLYINSNQAIYPSTTSPATTYQYFSPTRYHKQNWVENYPGTAGSLDIFNSYFIGNPDATLGTSHCNYCEVGEIILFERTLSDGERAEIERYLRRKWNITTNNNGA